MFRLSLMAHPALLPHLPPRQMLCYKITMTDPLSPTSGILPRLTLAVTLVAAVWGAVAWAIA